jgi:hypothetical protein
MTLQMMSVSIDMLLLSTFLCSRALADQSAQSGTVTRPATRQNNSPLNPQKKP